MVDYAKVTDCMLRYGNSWNTTKALLVQMELQKDVISNMRKVYYANKKQYKLENSK